MAFETGTATGHVDLLSKLRTFAVANGWVEERWLTNGDGEQELCISSTGITGEEYYTCGFQTRTNEASDIYNWLMHIAPIYTDGDWDAQVNMSPVKCGYFNDREMEYWFILNARRIIIVVHVDNGVELLYLGKLFNYTSLGHWPSAMVICGTGTNPNGQSSDDSNDHSTLQTLRGENQTAIYAPDDNWTSISSTYPTNTATMNQSPFAQAGLFGADDSWMQQMLATHSSWFMLGEYEGLYWVAGHQVSPLDTFTNNVTGNTMLVLPNIRRVTLFDFCAVELA